MPYLTDPTGDLLTRMRNAQKARHVSCRAPWSRINEALLKLLQQEGWVTDVRVLGPSASSHSTSSGQAGQAFRQELEVTFEPGKTLTLKRVSKPGRRVYSPAAELKPVLQGYGIAVLTTSQGLLTDKEARKRKVGGEVLCTVS